ncbi:hypothetical protein ABIE67_009230 [Streptomyces sp. V4I8]|uniref:hypothetical protein n=1 Tax=Streptomyces sp. V4I8 TaxID=3156469 RepID=UPI00351519E2
MGHELAGCMVALVMLELLTKSAKSARGSGGSEEGVRGEERLPVCESLIDVAYLQVGLCKASTCESGGAIFSRCAQAQRCVQRVHGAGVVAEDHQHLATLIVKGRGRIGGEGARGSAGMRMKTLGVGQAIQGSAAIVVRLKHGEVSVRVGLDGGQRGASVQGCLFAEVKDGGCVMTQFVGMSGHRAQGNGQRAVLPGFGRQSGGYVVVVLCSPIMAAIDAYIAQQQGELSSCGQ